MRTLKILVAAGLLLGTTSVMAQDPSAPTITPFNPSYEPAQTGDPLEDNPNYTNNRPNAPTRTIPDVSVDKPMIDNDGKLIVYDGTNDGVKRNVKYILDEDGKLVPNHKKNDNGEYVDENNVATTDESKYVIDEGITVSDGGVFRFVLPDAFQIACDDSRGTIAASDQDNHLTDVNKGLVEDMMVPDFLGLKNAKAVISCRATTTRMKWALKLDALYGGKMKDSHGSGFLKLANDDHTEDGELGMWIEFTKSWTLTDNEKAGYGNDIMTYGGTPVQLTEDGKGIPDAGNYIDNVRTQVNLANVLSKGTASRFTAMRGGSNVSTGFEFEIRAAFVDDDGQDIASGAGTYEETIVITLDSIISSGTNSGT